MALAPKKSVAIQVTRRPSPDVALALGRSGAGVTASSAGQAPPVVVFVPSTRQIATRAEGMPSEVTEQTATKAIPLPTSERMELPLALMASTAVGVMLPIEAPLTWLEVVATVTS